MKHFLASLLMVTALATSALADGRFYTKTIRATDPALKIEVPEGRYVRVLNFVQDGLGTFTPDNNNSGGVFNVGGGSYAIGALALSQGGGAFVTVLTAAMNTDAGSLRTFTIAGPATLTIAPNPPAALVVSYLKAEN